MTDYISIDGFREAAKGKLDVAEASVFASFDTEIRVESDSRTLTFAVSSAAVDRMGDSISAEGWKLDAYRKNPVVLWAHDATHLPVARASKIWIEDNKLKAAAEFTPAGMARFNDTVYEMYKQGFLSATSVGFMPLKFAFTEDPKRRFGIDFIEQELLEFSAVPVPANPEALIEARAAGIQMEPMVDYLGGSDGIIRLAETFVEKGDLLAWAELLIEEHGKTVVTRERIEKIERAATQDRLRRKRERDLELIRLRA